MLLWKYIAVIHLAHMRGTSSHIWFEHLGFMTPQIARLRKKSRWAHKNVFISHYQGVAQLVARTAGGREVASSSLVTLTMHSAVTK